MKRYFSIFGRLLLYSIPASSICFFPYGVFTALVDKTLPSLALFLFGPIAGPLYSLPALLLGAFFCKWAEGKSIFKIWPYVLVGGLLSTLVTGGIFYKSLFAFGFSPAMHLLLCGAFVGAVYIWRSRKRRAKESFLDDLK